MKQRFNMKNANIPATVNSNVAGRKVDSKTYVLLFIICAIGVLFVFMIISLLTKSKMEDL